MKIINNKTNKLKLLIFSTLLIVVASVGLFFMLGGTENARRIYYGHVVRQAYHNEYGNLGSALEGLGLSENKSIKSVCEAEEVATDGINASTVLFCALQNEAYVEVTGTNTDSLIKAAEQLDDLTSKYNGVMYENTGPTFSKYISDITNGVDYHPDFGATFVRDNYLCEVHMNIAFSNPKPPAYSIQFGCNSPRITTEDNFLAPPCVTDCDEQV